MILALQILGVIAAAIAVAPIFVAILDDEKRRRARRAYQAETGCTAPPPA